MDKIHHHLLIAGTGRSGTSFLVKYFTGLGLDTHLSRNPSNTSWNEEANAGLEDIPLTAIHQNLPYVIKTPWLYQFVDQVLSEKNIKLDAVIIPVRDLTEAAASRTILEMKSIFKNIPWMQEMDDTWESFAYTPGGVIFSLDPLDQARLLATDFHHLIHKLVKADIPIVFLEFPKFIDDGNYLFHKIKHLLPAHAQTIDFKKIHNELSDLSKVRVGKEIDAEENTPSVTKIANIALKRELKQTRKKLEDSNVIINNLMHENQTFKTQQETLAKKVPISNHKINLKIAIKRSIKFLYATFIKIKNYTMPRN